MSALSRIGAARVTASRIVTALLSRLNLRPGRRSGGCPAAVRSKTLFETLEPRLLLSADLMPGAGPTATQTQEAVISTSTDGSLVMTMPSDASGAGGSVAAWTSGLDVGNFQSPLSPLNPRGSLVYAGAVSESLDAANPRDTLDIDLDANQVFSLRFVPEAGSDLQAEITVLDPNGNFLAYMNSGAAGATVEIQLMTTGNGGNHQILIDQLAGAGAYRLELFLNAALESPDTTGSSDAQNLGGGFVLLPGGPGSRAAVVGQIAAGMIQSVVEENFEAELGANWSLASYFDGYVTREGGAAYGGEISVAGTDSTYLAMHGDQSGVYNPGVDGGEGYNDYDPTLNEAIWTVDLGIAGSAVLTFEEWGRDEYAESFVDEPFYGSQNADGVAISVDGTLWFPILNLPAEYSTAPSVYTIDLMQAAADWGLTPGADFRVKFQHYDNPNNFNYLNEQVGHRFWDNIRISTQEAQRLLEPVSVSASTIDFNNGTVLLYDGNVPAEGSDWDAGSNVWWTGQEVYQTVPEGELGVAAGTLAGLYFDLDLGSVQRVADLLLSVDNNDDYAVDYSVDGVDWTRLVNVWSGLGDVNVGMDTFSSNATDSQYDAALNFDPVMARYLRIYATGGDGSYALGEVRATADNVSDPEDWYALTLAEGEMATFTVSHQDLAAGAGLTLELRDAANNLLTAGVVGGSGVNKAIENFRAPTAGTYYLRVSGQNSGDYDLVAVKEARFGPATDALQDLTLTPVVLDTLSGAPAEVRVAVLWDGSSQPATQLNDDTYFNFTATNVYSYQIDTLAELNQYDVVVIGASQSKADLINLAPALRQWVEAGHGLVTTGWMVYYGGASSGTVVTDLDAIVPVALSGSYGYNAYPTVVITDSSHPVTQGVSSFSNPGGYGIVEWSSGGADAGATVLGTTDGHPTVVVNTPGAGRSAYLGPVYPYYNWSSGMADRLLEQAVAWAARPASQYTVEALPGELSISLELLGADAGEPVNDLVPELKLYDPAGNLLASGSDFLAYTVEAAGSFVIQVSGAGSGDYVLRVAGNLPVVAQPLEVIASSLDAVPDPSGDGVRDRASFPGYVDLTFSEPVLLTSLENFDLGVNYQDADGNVTAFVADSFEVMSPTVARFNFAGAASGDGVYTLVLAAGGVGDIHGNDNLEWSIAFDLDTTGPRVIGSSVSEGGTLEAGTHTLTFVFDEDLDTSSLDQLDGQLRENRSGRTIAITSAAYDSGTDTLTIGTPELDDGDYTLTLFSGFFGFKDLVSNALDGDGDGVPGGNYVINFSVDTTVRDYPAMQGLLPAGSLVYDPLIGGLINAAGDVDSYDVSLDAGQTLTVIAAVGRDTPDLQLELAVVDINGTPVEVAVTTGTPGEGLVVQTVAGLAGDYRIEVRGLQGSGHFDFVLLLNAALEEEMLVGTFGNDDTGSAQDIEASSLDLGNDGSRLAVVGHRWANSGLGEPAFFEANGHYYEVVSAPGLSWQEARIAAEARTYRGGTGHLVSVTSAAENLFLTNVFGEGELDSHYLGGYQNDGSVEPAGGWNWTTGESFYGFTNWATGEPNDAGDEKYLHYISGSDAEGMWWNDTGAGWPDAAGYVVEYDAATQADDDFYRFHLEAGQVATVALAWADADAGNDVAIELQDGGGNVLAIGSADAANAKQVIRDFTAQSGGDYFLRVSGNAIGLYNLVVTRGIAFALPSNQVGAPPQDISQTGQVLGALRSGGSAAGGVIAVVAAGANDAGVQAIVNQLNDHSTVSLSAVLVSTAQVDTLPELMQYDAIVIGGTGNNSNQFASFAANLKPYVEAGGGLVVTGWGIYAAGGLSGQTRTDFDAIVPINVDGSYSYFLGSSVVPGGIHPIVDGVGPFYVSTYIEFPAGNPKVDAGATTLATVGSTPVAAANNVGNGRTVYLGPIYAAGDGYDTSGLRSGEADQLMEQAVAWAAGGRGISVYSIEVNAGDALTITTTTPGDGSGEPGNTLDPRVELRDPAGEVVATDTGGAADGRNVLLTHTATASGAYTVRVLVESGQGDFVLNVAGATGTPAPLSVTHASIAEGQVFGGVPPTSVDLDFSEALLLTSLAADDLRVNGLAANSVTVIDANTLRFDISGLLSGDGSYTLALAAAALSDLQGTGNVAFNRGFTVDATLPTVTASSVSEGETLTPGARSFTFTLSEDLASSGLAADDVLLVNGATGLNTAPTSFAYDANTDQVTVQYANLQEGNYTLTLVSGSGAFRDLVGNPLNGDTSDPDADNFVVHFNIDAAATALAFSPVDPVGGLVYKSEAAGRALHGTGDVDTFTVSLDPGQTLTVWAVPTTGSAVMAIELFDAGGVSLGRSEASGSGQAVLLQTLAIAGAGTYSVEVSSLGGSGQYTLKALLNAAAEVEMLAGPANDTLATAQDLAASFITTGSDRAAVVGQRHASGGIGNLAYYNGHYYELVAGNYLNWSQANDGAQARSHLGATGHLATINSVGESLFINNTFGSVLDGAWLGGYQPAGSVEPAGGWTWVTGESFGFTNWGGSEPNNAGGSENYLHFSSSVDAEGRQWNDITGTNTYFRYLVEYEPSVADDWYSFTLAEGQVASVVLQPEAGALTSNLSVELYDASGLLLTAGTDAASNVDEVIADFVAPTAGSYYLRVAGSAPGQYNLVVTRDQAFGLELGADAQDISLTGEVLAGLGASAVASGQGVRVAVLNNGAAGQVVNQLNDDTYFDFTATSVTYLQIDTLAELSAFDVVMLGDSNTPHTQIEAIAPVLRQWVEAGGGIVGTGWLIYSVGSETGTPIADIDAIVPVNTGSRGYYWYPTLDITDSTHPVTTGVADFGLTNYGEYPAGGADAGATVLGNFSGQPAVVVGNAGSGRGVYLGPLYMVGASGLNGGAADRLLEQAVAWAGGDNADEYLVQVNVGDQLQVRTATPGDGAGEPPNLLDPAIELFDETGTLMASDADSAADGRNATLSYTALSSGAYKLRVSREPGSARGEYVLSVTGATGTANPSPQVVASDPLNGQRLATPPASLTLDLSEAIRADSVGADDLTIDGGASVTGVQVVDGDTVRFLLDVPSVEGSYNYTLLADGISDLQGQGNSAYTGGFVLDFTPPRVVSQNPEVQSISPFASWSVTFSEALDPASVQTGDFVLRNPSNGTIGISTATVSADGLTVTLVFGGQYTQGNYTLTVGPDIADVAGNRMDQDAGTAGNQTYVGSVQVASPDLSPISINVTLPDGSPLPEGGVALGSQVRVEWTVRNVGTDAARAAYWYDRLLISTDTNPAGDTYLGESYIDVDPGNATGLLANGDYTMTANVTLPLNDNFGAGTYYIRVQTDIYGYQPENNENNNNLFSAAFTTVVPPLPDLTVLSVTAPEVIEVGKNVTVSWTVHNQGGAAATGDPGGYWRDRVVLSQDQTFGNNDDRYLNEIYYYDDVAPGQDLPRSTVVNVSNSYVGTWYVLVKTDYYNEVYERANENNNVGIGAAQVQVIVPTEDLHPVELTAPDAGIFGSAIDVSWTVGNIGTGPTYGNWYDRLWLSTDATRGNDDIYLTEVSASASPDVRPVAAGTDYTRSVQGVALPLSVSLSEGTYYLLVESDVYGWEPETNENNNVLARPIELSLADYADLTVSDVVVPTEDVHSGDTITVEFTINNQGAGAAADFHNYLYLSSDGAALDRYVGDYHFNQTLAAGDSATVEKAITIPLYSPGDWYVVVVADIHNQIYEHANEGNNRAASALAMHAPLPPLPDPVVSNIVAPEDALAGEAITVSWTITNLGDKSSGSWVDRLYLSTDGGASDNIYLGDFTFEGILAVGASVSRTQSFTLSPTQQGPRTVVVYTDVGNWVNETPVGETNNRSIDDTTIDVTFPPLPNLQVTALTPPSDPASGTQTVVSWVVTNTGTGATSAPVWYDQVRLSLNNVWGDGDDLDMGTVANPNYLSAGESYQNSLTISIPKGLNGDYYFLVKTDIHNQVFEDQFENDNVLGTPTPLHIDLTPPPDLRVDSVEAQNLAFSGQPMSISWTIGNHGLGRTVESAWYDRVVMSADDQLGNADDRNMGDFLHSGALDADESYTVNKSITLPIGVVGEFYFFVITDRANHVYEHGSEFNNTGVDLMPDGTTPETTTIQLTPPPDLEVFSVAVPANGEAGHGFNVNWRVVNFGATATPNNYWVDRLWLSADATLGAGDIHLGDRGHYGVLGVYEEDADGNAVTGYYDSSASFNLPYDLVGSYRVIVQTDVGNAVFEGFVDPVNPDGEDNNTTVSNAMNVISRPADLVVESLSGPPGGTGEAGKQIALTWTVRNVGSGDTVANAWFDAVLISADDILGDADDVFVQSFGRGGLLNAGDGYTRTETVTLPFSLDDGSYRVYLITDYNGNVHESENGNNFAFFDLLVDRETADLRVVGLAHEAAGMVALPLDVSWRVENQGTNQTNVNNWYDDVFLSLDQVLDNSDVYLGQRYRNAALAMGAGYDADGSFTLPNNLSPNDYYVIVRTDKYNGVTEGNVGEGNNVRVSDTTVHVVAFDPNNSEGVQPPELLRPDLHVTLVDAPAAAVSGQTMDVSWTVRNEGPDPTGNRTWYDAIYLSRDGVLDRNADFYLGYRYHTGLAVGDSYTETMSVSVPFGQSGPFYVFVAADAGRYITEADELNNVGQDAAFTQVALAPPADLVVGTITVPDNGIPGTQATIDFSVENQGTNPALGSWNDSVYLSADETWDINDPLFGVATHHGNVAGGSSYSASVTAALPGVTPGDYFVIVRSDIRNYIPESDETNNIAASLDAVAMDVEALTLGVPDTGQLGWGQAVYYKFDVAAGETVRIVLDSVGEDIANELYVRHGSMPTRGQFDVAAREGFVADPELLIPTSEAGTYYVLAYGQYAPGNPQFSITASIIPFSITAVDARQVGDFGDATLRIQGARFAADTAFRLVGPDGGVVEARSVYLDNSSEAYVTFALYDAPIGLYDVVAEQANGGVTTLADALTVIDGQGPAVFMSIAGPTQVMVNRTNLFTLDYVNDGDADALAPLMIIESLSATPMGLSASNLRTTPIHVLAASFDGPMDILRPGGRYSVPVVFQSSSVAQQLDMRVGRIMANDVRLIEDWDAIEASVRPLGVDDADWDAFWGRVQPLIGASWGEYVQILDHMMTLVSNPGQPIRDVSDIFARMLVQNPDYVPYSSLHGEVRDSVGGAPLADVQMAAYLVHADGLLEYKASAISDENGEFGFARLVPGTYKIAAIGRALDMNRDGQIDVTAPQVAVGETAPADAGVIYIQPLAGGEPDDDSNPALVRDADGVTHAVWNRAGLVWHAWYDGSQWRDAQAISTAQSYAPAIAASGKLFDGVKAGVIVAWQQGSGNDAEIWYAVARAKAGGGFEWSAPVQLTDDDTLDVAPEVIVGDTGVAMITHLKRDGEIQDDTDIYYDILALGEADFVWPTAALAATAEPSGETPIGVEGVSVSYGRQWKFGPWDFFGTEAEVVLALTGQVGENNCKATLGAQGQVSGSFKGSSIRSTISGNGNVSAEWGVNEAARDWLFTSAKAGWGASAQFDWRYGLSTLLSKIPHPAVTSAYLLYTLAVAIGEKVGLTFEDGITFGGGASFSNMEWKFIQPFPDFVWPESIAEASINGLIGLYAQLDVGPTGDSVRVEGNINVTVDIAPEVKLKSVTGNIIFSGNIGWFPFNETFSVDFYSADGLDVLAAPIQVQEEYVPVFDPAALVGTGNAYGSNHVLADVSGDLLSDSSMSLANDAGAIFGAWTQMADPYGTQLGWEVMTAEYGSGWGAPVALPGSLGINSNATAVVDGSGRRMIVWTYADSSGLGTAPTLAEYEAALDTNNVVYATYNEAAGTWSMQATVAATAGMDSAIAVGHDAAGNVVMTWVVHRADDLDHLMSATWNGSAWSAAVEIASGASLTDPALERLGDGLIVVWEEDADPDPGETVNTLHYSIHDGLAWSAGALFDPIAMATGLALSAGQPLAEADAGLQTEAVFPPFPVPEECLKCKPEDIKRIRESAPECIPGGGTQVTFDPKTCTEKTIVYKPCVVRPRDPNDIIGPTGYGDEKWVAAKNTMAYTIRFENAADATAPAQQVVVTQQLDDDLDWRTFRVDDFGFGDQLIELDGKSAFYQKRLDFTDDPERGFFLDVSAAIDVATGIVTWTLTTIDPGTGEIPQDASIGFLPPNDTVYDENHNVVVQGTGKGEGFVNYTVKAKRTAETGTVVDAEARIVFDTEEPIDTPAIFNTLDAGVPQSQVIAFADASTEATEILVSWSGEDDAAGSGIRDFTIYVSHDGGDFEIWLADTDLTEGLYVGAAGHTYSFYSTVRDWAGNEEAEADTADATITVTGAFGALSGIKFEDRDGDGQRDDGEAGLAGWTLYLDANNDGQFNDGEASASSGADGSYSFADLTPGDYVVREIGQAGWVQTQPGGDGSRLVTVLADTTTTDVDFGNFKLAQIGGQKFNDLDANGTADAGEVGLSGWTIQLDKGVDGSIDATTTTDEYGYYRFTNLGPGSYRVTEVLQSGWLQTAPAGGSHTVTPSSGEDAGGNDFANVQAASISGVKFEDSDGDGQRDAGESGLPGWTIFLDLNANGSLDGGERSVVTGADGVYTFADLLPGDYVVAEVMQSGWTQTSPGARPSGVAGLTLSGIDAELVLPDVGFATEGLSVQNVSANEMADALVGLDAFRADPRFAGIDGDGVTTVVIDTGIDLNHAWFGPDGDSNGVADRIVFSWDFADGDADASDGNGHGSHVTSLIGSQDATYGGVAPGADLIALKVFEDSGAGYFSYLEEALQWVVAHADDYDIGVVNMSLGDGGNWESAIGRYGLGDELAALASLDILVTAAAGNNFFQLGGALGLAYPAADPAVISVGAVWSGSFGGPVNYANGAIDYSTGADRLAAFGQRDDALLDVVAPGTRMVGANFNGGARTMYGTSQASAYLAGVATLAQDLALDHLGRKLSLAEFTTLLDATGVVVVDGDDENDNVANTGLSFPRVNVFALAEGILAMETLPDGGDGDGAPVDDSLAHPLAAPGVYALTLAAGEDADAVDFGNFRLGSISGTVFHDLDADQAQGSLEPGLPGWTVFLDDGDGVLEAGEQSVVSVDGSYHFADLGPGTYRVTLLGQDGWAHTTDSFFDVFITSGLAADADFGVNAKPTLDGIGDIGVDEGGVVSFSAVGHDSAGDALSYSVVGVAPDLIDPLTGAFLWSPADGDTDVAITVRVTDLAGSIAAQSFNVHVANVAPTLHLDGPASVTDDETFTLTLSATDPGEDTVSGWTVNWGDGSSSALNSASGDLGHRYRLPGDYAIDVGAADEDGSYSASRFISVEAGTLKVTSLEWTNTGYDIRFNRGLGVSHLNLYDAEDPDHPGTRFGAADAVLKDGANKVVAGSIVLDDDQMGYRFIKSGNPKTDGLLAAGAHTLTLQSRSDGFTDALGGLLDGDGNGVAGGNYNASFTQGSGGATLILGEIARGPGQALNPAGVSTGFPVRIANGAGVSEIRFHLDYDPALLSITGVSSVLPGASTVADWSTPGRVNVSITGIGGLSNLLTEVVRLQATVPDNAPYGAKNLLDLGDVRLFVGSTELPGRDDDGLHVVAYAGDATGNGAYTTQDVQQIQRVLLRLDSGFGAYPLVDPTVIGNVTGNGTLSSLDTRMLTQVLNGQPQLAIPAIPAGIPPLTFSGTDPVVSVGTVDAKAGEVVTVPVKLDTAVNLVSLQLTLAYSATDLELVNVRVGGLTLDFGWFIKTVTPGKLTVDMSRLTALTGGSGNLLELDFKVAAKATGTLALDLQWAALNDTRLTPNPAPQPGPDATDGAIRVKAARTVELVRPRLPLINLAERASAAELGKSGMQAWVEEWLTGSQTRSSTGKLNNWKLSLPSR